MVRIQIHYVIIGESVSSKYVQVIDMIFNNTDVPEFMMSVRPLTYLLTVRDAIFKPACYNN